MNRTNVALVLSFVLGIASIEAWRSCREHVRGQFRGTAVDHIPDLVGAPNDRLASLVVDNYREYRGNSVRWSGVYFGCIFGAAALSAFAALFLKLSILDKHERLQKDLSAILATICASHHALYERRLRPQVAGEPPRRFGHGEPDIRPLAGAQRRRPLRSHRAAPGHQPRPQPTGRGHRQVARQAHAEAGTGRQTAGLAIACCETLAEPSGPSACPDTDAVPSVAVRGRVRRVHRCERPNGESPVLRFPQR